jgi:Hypoxia induced protein conserved region
MDKLVFTLLIVAMGLTLGVLFLGLFSMARGGQFAKRNSNRFMRWRVIMQGIAILLFVIFMMTWHRS